MNKILTIFLLLIFSFGIISCADNDSSGANSKMGSVLDQPNSTDDDNNMNLPIIRASCYLLDNSTYDDDSTIDNSSISDNSTITGSTVKNCSTVVSNSTIDDSTIDNSSISDNSTVDNSTITISKVCRSTIDNSTIDNSTICYSTIGWSDVDNSTIDNSTIDNSTIDNSTLTDSDFDNSTTGGGSNFDNVTGDNLTCTNCDLDDLICNDCVLDNVTVCNATLDNVTFTNVTACQDDGSGGYVPMDFDNETRENQTTTETVKPDLSSWTVLNSSSAWVSADLGTSSKTIRELTNIRVTFSEAMDTTTVTANSDNTSCSGSIQVTLSTQNFSTCIQMTANDPTTSDNVTFEVNPASALANINAKYYIKVLAGVKDMSGNSKSDDNVTSNGFVTCKYDVSAGCE